MTTQVNVGAPGVAAGRPQVSPPCAAILQGAAGGPPCQVARRAGGVAACVRPVSGRGRGRPRGPVVGRRPGPRSAGSEARRAVQWRGARRTDRASLAAWRGASGPPRAVPRASSGARRRGVCGHRGGGTALSPGASASAGRHRPGLASRGGPTAPRRAARPHERAGRAWPAWAPEGWVGQLCQRGRQPPTRSQATGREPPCRWAGQRPSSWPRWCQADSRPARCQRPYASAAQARRTAAAERPKAATPGMTAPRRWSRRPLRSLHRRGQRPRLGPMGTPAIPHDKMLLRRERREDSRGDPFRERWGVQPHFP